MNNLSVHCYILCSFLFQLTNQFVTLNSWKIPWNWIAFSQNSFVISPGLLYHLIRRDTGRLANETFTSNPIVSLKKYLSHLKITNCNVFINGTTLCTTRVPHSLHKKWSFPLRISSIKVIKFAGYCGFGHISGAHLAGGPGGPDPCPFSIQSKLCPQILKLIYEKRFEKSV